MEQLRAEIEILTREVARLAAHEAIRLRVQSYVRALDRLDGELLAAQFWPDAQVDYGAFYQGTIDGFLPIALGFQGSMRDTQHLVGNVLARVDGERASAESYVHAHHIIAQGGDLVQLMVGARYLDRLERRGGEWRISYRSEILDWGRWLPVSERWFETSNELPKGTRGYSDISYRYLLPGR